MFKVLAADKLAQEGIELLKEEKDFEVEIKTGLSPQELAEVISEYDGLIVRSGAKVTAEVIERAKRLKAIARAGVGVDNIDIPAATRKGILVMNTPGGNTLSAAEHTVALMLALTRNVVPACNSLKAGKWDRKKYTGNQLNGKTLGIIGLGRIGMSVAKMAKGFDMKIAGYDPFAVPKQAEELGIEIVDDLKKIFTESDFISLHVPKNDQTVNMITKAELELMKPTVRIINCARGGIINEDDLYDALSSGRIAGAALDVFEQEPPANKRFAEIENCLVTPHLGASTKEAQTVVAVEAARILIDAIKGGPIRNAVNAPSIDVSMPAIVRNYADLAKRIGTIIASITPGRIKSVEVQYRGGIAQHGVDVITANFTAGLLEPNVEGPVNIVNAPVLAKERGISIDQTVNTDQADLASSITAKMTTDKATRSVTGTVFADSLLRITEVDGFNVEFTPEDTVVIIYNEDKPGVIGAVGMALAKHNININTMGVGQKTDTGSAMLALTCPEKLSQEFVKELASIENVQEVYSCRLG